MHEFAASVLSRMSMDELNPMKLVDDRIFKMEVRFIKGRITAVFLFDNLFFRPIIASNFWSIYFFVESILILRVYSSTLVCVRFFER